MYRENGEEIIDHRCIESMAPDELVDYLKSNSNSKSLRFASGISGYYVRYSDEVEQFQVVAAGPNGVESEIASIDERNIELLHMESELINLVKISKSPFE